MLKNELVSKAIEYIIKNLNAEIAIENVANFLVIYDRYLGNYLELGAQWDLKPSPGTLPSCQTGLGRKSVKLISFMMTP